MRADDFTADPVPGKPESIEFSIVDDFGERHAVVLVLKPGLKLNGVLKALRALAKAGQ